MAEKALKVGIIGQGRSGRDIHGNLLAQICSETLTWHQDSWSLSIPGGKSQLDHMTRQVYLMLYRTIKDGAALEITPQQVRQQMMVMEECRRQNSHIYSA